MFSPPASSSSNDVYFFVDNDHQIIICFQLQNVGSTCVGNLKNIGITMITTETRFYLQDHDPKRVNNAGMRDN